MNMAQWLSLLSWRDLGKIDSMIWVYVSASALSVVFSLLAVVFYRLYLSPLAQFPGPRLAAVTGFYETSYDVVQNGQFTWQIERLHQKYGPVVRIKPWELHVKDPDYYNTLYAGPTKKRNKDSWFSFLGWPQSIFSTEGHALHRVRRSVLGQFFTKRAILDLVPVVQTNIQSLSRHFRRAQSGHDTLELHAAFLCFASDTLSQHAFGVRNGFHSLEEEQISSTWKTKVNSCFELVQLARHFPWICKIAHVFPWPSGMVCAYFDEVIKLETVRWFSCLHSLPQKLIGTQDVKKMVRNAIKERGTIGSEKRNAIYPTILENEKVPEDEKKFARLADDAIFLMIAGTDAPSQALSITLFHVLRHPEVHERVRTELFTAWENASVSPDLVTLEQLPYFVCPCLPQNKTSLTDYQTAVLKEGLRLSSIVTTRLPRIAPDEVLQFHGWEIPRGVCQSFFFFLEQYHPS